MENLIWPDRFPIIHQGPQVVEKLQKVACGGGLPGLFLFHSLFPSFLWSNVGVVWCQSDLALTWEGIAVQHLNELEQMVSGVG